MSHSNDQLTSLVNASGYFFQLKVADEIRKSENRHGMRVLVPEHRWENSETGEEGFIDLVLRFGTHGKLVIECKRVRGDGQWVFLVPLSEDKFVHRVKILWSIPTNDNKAMIAWDSFNLGIGSFASSFCIVRGQGEKSPSMLERLAGWLINATECLAYEEMQFDRGEGLSSVEFYFPVIITNARLMVCRYKPEDINLKSGELPTPKFEEVHFIRFTKSLPSRLPSSYPPSDLQHASNENERTILVINEERMIKFFSEKWEIGYTPFYGVPTPPWKAVHWEEKEVNN